MSFALVQYSAFVVLIHFLLLSHSLLRKMRERKHKREDEDTKLLHSSTNTTIIQVIEKEIDQEYGMLIFKPHEDTNRRSRHYYR